MQFTAEMIAGLLNGTIVGDKGATVSTVSSIDGGKAGSLAYLTNPKYEQYIYTTEASIVLVDNTFEPKQELSTTLIKVANVGECVLSLLEMYNASRPRKRGVSKLASISEEATIGEECYVGDFTVVERGVKIGANCQIYPQCYIGWRGHKDICGGQDIRGMCHRPQLHPPLGGCHRCRRLRLCTARGWLVCQNPAARQCCHRG